MKQGKQLNKKIKKADKCQFSTYLKPQSLDADLSHTLDAFLNAVQLAQVVLCVHNINISRNVH